MLIKSNLKKLFIMVLLVIAPMFAGAVNINQTVTIKNDGSGTMNFTYMEKDDVLKQKNFLIGNLPFTKEKIAEYFKAPNSYIQLSNVEKNPKDNTLTQVVIVISFTDINKLGEAKALANMNLSLIQTDSGKVFRNSISPDFVKTNSLNRIYCVLISESNIKSSNGKITDKSVAFFRDKEFLDGKSNVNFIATINAGATATGNNKDGSDKKSCGLFGLELPLLMLAGLIFSYNRKRFNN